MTTEAANITDNTADAALYNSDVILNMDEDLICGICRNIIRNACQPSEGDSHIFCFECLAQSLNTKAGCPICCLPSSLETVTKVAFIDRRINNLTAKCYAFKSGCEWQGSFLELREQHWPNECELHGQPCPLCEEMVPAAQRTNHMAQLCPKKRLACKLCQAVVLREAVEDHLLRVCPESEVDCPNDCGAIMLRKEEDHHLRHVCPEEVISCFMDGCSAKVKRKDMDSHLTSDPTLHLTLAIRELRQLKDLQELKELKSLASELRDLKGTIKKVESSVYGPRPLVMFDVTKEEFQAMREAYRTGLSIDKEFQAYGIDWKAHVYPCGHDDYEDYVSAFVGPIAASLPEGWVELRYKCLFELFADGMSVSHRVDDRVTVPPRPGRYGWFKFAEYQAIKDAEHLQFVISLLHANVILAAPEDAEPPPEERRPSTSFGLSLYVAAHVLIVVGLFAILRKRSAH